MLLAAAVIAIVTQDHTALRASPSVTAPRNAILWQGEALEVRGIRAGYLQVYDYRRERGGYVLEGQVRQYPLASTPAGGVLEAVRLFRDLQGFEALGIGHAALYLKIAPAQEIGPEVFDALGTMADRLARRASARSSPPGEALAGHLDVAQGYGVKFVTLDQDGRTRTCYDGDAFRRALELQGTAEHTARAALGLTRAGCETGATSERMAFHEWAAETLDRVPLDKLPLGLRQRVRLRRVAVWSSLAFGRARVGSEVASQSAAARALEELALVNRSEVSETDFEIYDEAAVRAAASRSAVEIGPTSKARLTLRLAAKETGETCLTLVGESKGSAAGLLERCTYGHVWPASVRVAPGGNALAVSVQPLESWRELWVFHEVKGNWMLDIRTPSTEPSVGYVEWAGWSPDGTRLLAAREARVGGRFTRTFELLRLETMATERKAGRPGLLLSFRRWQSPDWKSQTLALR